MDAIESESYSDAGKAIRLTEQSYDRTRHLNRYWPRHVRRTSVICRQSSAAFS
jgi:hypothetical protein